MTSQHCCIDCAALPVDDRPLKPRPAIHGGPRSRRCATHFRAWKNDNRLKARVKRSQKVYGLEPGDRADLMALQGGKCPICNRTLDRDPRGRWNRTAHDHDHELAAEHDHPENEACPDCLRGLTCAWCNRELLVRIDLEAARRLVAYYEDPPMARMRRARQENAA